METEIWKDIVGYEGLYQVSSFGNVRSVDRTIKYSDGRVFNYKGKKLKFNECKRNYGVRTIHLYKDSKRRARYVHRLVAEAFVDGYKDGLEVNHIDGNRHNNCADNLEWVTRLENMQHGFETGLINNTGINHGNNVYSEDQIREVKSLLNENLRLVDIEKITGVKAATVGQIKRGKQWRHI